MVSLMTTGQSRVDFQTNFVIFFSNFLSHQGYSPGQIIIIIIIVVIITIIDTDSMAQRRLSWDMTVSCTTADSYLEASPREDDAAAELVSSNNVAKYVGLSSQGEFVLIAVEFRFHWHSIFKLNGPLSSAHNCMLCFRNFVIINVIIETVKSFQHH